MTRAHVTTDGVLREIEGTPSARAAFIPTPAGENHASFLAVDPVGDLWCAWFGGSREGRPDVSIYLSRQRSGSNRWDEPVVVSDDAELSEQNPVVWFPRKGMMEVLYTAQSFGSQDTAVVRSRWSNDEGATWSPSEQILSGSALFIRQRPHVTSDGGAVLPLFRCTPLAGRVWKGDADVSLVATRRGVDDEWRMHEVPESTGLVHMDVLPAGDGSLVALFRSRWADFIYRSTSVDGGTTWSTPVPTELPNNNSSIQAVKLSDGRIAVVFNDVNAETSPPAEVTEDPTKLVAEGEPAPLDREAVWGVRRVPLTVATSDDDGITWTRRCVLEPEVDGAAGLFPARAVDGEMSYPSVVVRGDEMWVSYTYDRAAIRTVALPLSLMDDAS